MGKVVRILYVDDSRKSRKAEKLLRSSGLTYERLDVTDSPPGEITPPHLLTSEGEFDGLRNIEIYTQIFSRTMRDGATAAR